MIKFLLHIGRILLFTIFLAILWIISLQIAEIIIPSQLDTAEVQEVNFFIKFLIVCFIHVLILYLTIQKSSWSGLRLSVTIFILIFGIQYFLSMIEAVWFNESLNMPISGIQSILISGFILSFIFSPLMVFFSGKFRRQHHEQDWASSSLKVRDLIWKSAILAIIVYPLLYFLAGYYIAWQSEAVRLFYTGSFEMNSFGTVTIENLRSGLYGFQILRGLLWIGLAIPVYIMTEGSYLAKGFILGLLFALLMNVQHLLPNPYFPEEVSTIHFIETASSNFIWGFVIAWFFNWSPLKKKVEL